MNPDEALKQAGQHFRSARFGDAMRSAHAVLARQPGSSHALRLLAAAAENQGDLAEADRALAALARIEPTAADCFDSLIRISHRRGDLHRLAEGLLGRVRLDPGRWELWNDLGAALERIGQAHGAYAAYRRAASVSPSEDRALLNLAALAFRQNGWTLAYRLAKRAEAITSPSADALLVAAHAAQALGRTQLARIGYRRFLTLAPANADGWQGISSISEPAVPPEQQLLPRIRAWRLAPAEPIAMVGMADGARIAGDPGAACSWARKAISLLPSLAASHNALFNAYTDLTLDLDALRCAHRAVHLAPARGELHVNLGIALKELGRLKEAEQAIRAGLARRPDDPAAHMSLATTLLIGGRLREGLEEYEWRNVGTGSYYDTLSIPIWDGRPIPSGRLLIWGEQGVGDQILFSQFIRRALERAPNILVECDGRLVSILRRTYPNIEVIERNRHKPDLPPGSVAAQLAICSLPRVLGLDMESFQSKGAYLVPDRERSAPNAARLRLLGDGLKVGIAWRSLKDSPYARRHHTRLTEWGGILRTPNIRFVNLQYGDRRDEIAEVSARFGVDIAQFDDIDMFNDLDGLLALSSQLDLVLATATTAYVLAGAAGTEILHLMARTNYTLFGAGREPLSPRSRAFVREPGETWDPAIEALARALGQRVQHR